jgi:cardiolipin synthase
MQQAHLIGSVLVAIGFALGLAASGHALLHKRRPQSAFAWIAVSMSLPFAGALLYYLFGINRVQTRARKLRTEQPVPPFAVETGAAPAAPQFRSLAELASAISNLPLTAGNCIEALHNGEQAFPAMLDDIRNASTRVFLSSYIFDSGRVGHDFAEALGAAVARGVDVRVLLDGVGELYSWPRARTLLRRANVRYARFLPPRLSPPAFHINLRNHRKILVVDGCIAFTGGINIGDRCLAANTSNPHRVVDIHFRIRGPVVPQIEAVFLQDWQFVTDDTVPIEPAIAAPQGAALCRVLADGPDGELDRLTALLVGAIGAARRRVAIMTPYFLPPRELTGTLQAAALKGVDVAIILPARNNLPYIHWATRHMLWELLQRGVNIYYQPAPFVHSKLLLIDDQYALIGSANLDPRSLRLNFELDVEVYDQDFVEELGRHFDAVRARAAMMTLRDARSRNLPTRLRDGLAWLISPYL